MDRLAVWTYSELGEEIACGHPSVTDEQRSAAGRETLAERSAALLVTNRQRAQARYGEELGLDVAARVWRPRDAGSLRARLGPDGLAVWAEGDVLHVIWCGHAEQVMLGGGIQPVLWPVDGADDLWEASLRIRRLDEASISIIVLTDPGDHLAVVPAAHAVWRGARAPGPPATAETLAGTIDDEVIDSAALGAPRGLTVYRPPSPPERLPICILADGQSVQAFAGVLDAAIQAGDTPAVLLAGVHHALDRRRGQDGRTREYVPGADRPRFRSHLRFVTDEVIPHLRDRFPVAPHPVVAAGYSNGAAWAIAAAQRRPDVFGAVAALSPGVVPSRITRGSRAAGVRHYLASGILEPGFRRSTQEWAARLHRARMPCRHQEWAGGHDDEWWGRNLPIALAWLLSREAG